MTYAIVFICQQQKCVLQLFDPFWNFSLRQSNETLEKEDGVK